ncbi:MAG: hypothetical protein K1Y02_14575 [Candidatus Hydrogenedentes bacterium]|nr:hypothetical protein [Candidatus Hydrogenedentota bacterium]
MRWLRWFVFGVAALLVLPSCQTVSAVNDLANAIVGTALKTAEKALNAETYKNANSSTTAKQDIKAYKTWAQRYASQYSNQGNVKSSTKSTRSAAREAARAERKRKRDVAYTRYGVEVDKPEKKRKKRSHAPTNPYWQE